MRFAFRELKLVRGARRRRLAGRHPGRQARRCKGTHGRGRAVGRQHRSRRCSPRSSRISARRHERHERRRGAERERLRGFAVRVSLLFAAIFFVAGTNLPYLPVWLDWRGLSAREIAIITAAPLFVRVVVTPAIAFAADRAGDHRRFLIGAVLGGAGRSAGAGAVARVLADPRLHCCCSRSAWTDHHAADRDGGHERRQGRRARLRPHAAVGSLSFIAASLVRRLGGGARWAPGSAIWLIVGGVALTIAAAHGLAAADRARAAEGGDQPAAPAAAGCAGAAALARVPDLPAGRRRGAGRARRVLHLRHAALARAGPLDRRGPARCGRSRSSAEVALFAFSARRAAARRRRCS